jgi:hypothetical protein
MVEECYNALLGSVGEIFDGASLPLRELAQRLEAEAEARAKQVCCLFDPGEHESRMSSDKHYCGSTLRLRHMMQHMSSADSLEVCVSRVLKYALTCGGAISDRQPFRRRQARERAKDEGQAERVFDKSWGWESHYGGGGKLFLTVSLSLDTASLTQSLSLSVSLSLSFFLLHSVRSALRKRERKRRGREERERERESKML